MKYEEFDEKGMVICQECGKALKQITVQHLKVHSMSFEAYKTKYPNLSTVSKAFSAKQKLRNIDVFEEDPDKKKFDEENFKEITTEEEKQLLGTIEEISVEDYGDIDIDKIPIVSKNFSQKISSFIDDVKDISKVIIIDRKYPESNNIHKSKIKFLNFLVNYFSDMEYIKNSYYVDKMSGSKLEERLITDISIPIIKLDIEFPDVFWHNKDNNAKEIRDGKLKQMGWTIIDMVGYNPSIEDLKKNLEKLNLIC
jgi:hypothetical protein